MKIKIEIDDIKYLITDYQKLGKDLGMKRVMRIPRKDLAVKIENEINAIVGCYIDGLNSIEKKSKGFREQNIQRILKLTKYKVFKHSRGIYFIIDKQFYSVVTLKIRNLHYSDIFEKGGDYLPMDYDSALSCAEDLLEEFLRDYNKEVLKNEN